MGRMKHRRAVQILVVCLFLPAIAAGCGVDLEAGGAEGDFDRTLAVNGPVDLSLRSGSGNVDVEPGTDNAVHVRGHVRTGVHWLGPDPVQRVRDVLAVPPIQQSGNVITIGRTDGDARYRDVGISYVITVPSGTRIESRVGSGSQSITRVDGPVEASTGSGRITIDQVRGNVKATTGSGAIYVEGATAQLEARTGSGAIHVDGSPRQPWNLRTGSGQIDVRVDNQTPFDLDAQTGSGGVVTAQPVVVSGQQSRQRLSGSVRGGGAVMRLRTGSGSIRIE